LAAEQGAREQSKFEQTERAQDYTNVFTRLRDQGFVTVDTDADNPRLRLSKDFNTRLASGDAIAQQAAIDISNRGLQGKVPEGFTIDRIDTATDADGNATFIVGGVNADGSRGVLTEEGTSDDNALAKQFGGDELFKQVQFAFQDRNGVLYGQRAVDLNSFANSRDLIIANGQGELFEALQSNPAAQRQASATIATAETPEEEAELTNQLRQDVGLPAVEIPPESDPEPEPEAASTPAAKPAPTDNSAQIAKLEQEIAEIDGRKTAGRPANQRAKAQKQRELNRLKDESEPEPEGEGIMSKVLAAQNRTFGGPPIPAKVEQVIAPVVEDKTIAEIDEAVDNGDLQIDQETAAAAAQDLQEQGVETAADLAKLDPRRQAFAYAMIIASTPNDGNRRAVRDQLINILETGVSDRGKSATDDFKADTGRMNAIQAAKTFGLQVRKYIDQNNDQAGKDVSRFYKEIYEDNFDEDGELTGDPGAVKRLANQYVKQIYSDSIGYDTPQAQQLAKDALNTAVSLTVQVLADEGKSGGIVDKFQSLFRKNVSGTTSYDVSGLVRAGDLIYYREKDAQGDLSPRGGGVSVNALRKVDPDLADMIVQIADNNAKSGAESG
tara:strand:+ start:5822 stop:7651 length:1830 start_codon:yes stop_codon:yes gene_type:complete